MVTFFIEHFLISSILYEGSTSINLSFLTKKNFWYTILFLDFTGSNICINFIRVKNFSLISKIPKVWYDKVKFTKNSKSHKIRTSSSISVKFKNQTT